VVNEFIALADREVKKPSKITIEDYWKEDT